MPRNDTFQPTEPNEGDCEDFYDFATGGRAIIVSHDPAATARWLREIELESDRDRLLPRFTD